jgi:putative copper resistance protein D
MQSMAPFDPAFAVLRALHTVGAIVLFGELLFARVVANRAETHDDASRGHVLATAWAVATLAWIAWLVIEAAAMAGVAYGQATPFVARVLADTGFGHVWLLRAALLLALGAWLLRSRAAPRVSTPGIVLAGLVLASIAWSGHANAHTGFDGVVAHLADVLHVLAAGAWIGSLRPLAASLRAPPSADDAVARTVARYGTLGVVSICALVASGVVNAAYSLHEPARLFDSDYGRLLLGKLGLFAVVLAIAALNRWSLTPAIRRAAQEPEAAATGRTRLRRSAWIEAMLGAGIIALAGALASAAPPMVV